MNRALQSALCLTEESTKNSDRIRYHPPTIPVETMETNAYFENIQGHVLEQLSAAQHSITADIAWFTDPIIYDLLCEKAASGLTVRILLIDDHINCGPGALDFDRLRSAGGEVFLVPQGSTDNSRMHNKFCVVDGNTVMTGSYNWSRQAQKNRENLTVITGDPLFAGQFMAAFDTILDARGLKSSYSYVAQIDPILVIRRLELVRNLVLLEETDQIAGHLAKLGAATINDNKLAQIIELLEGGRSSDAVIAIGEYIARRQAIVAYQDPEISALQLELKSLEIELTAMDDEKAELERLIHEFTVRQTQEIGDLLVDYLRLKMEKLAREKKTESNPEVEAAYEEADQDYKEYREECEDLKKEVVIELDPEQKTELKKAYRRASKLCHPDKVPEDEKARAHDEFVALNQAYKENNLQRVKEILSALEHGKSFTDKAVRRSEKHWLVSEIRNMRGRREELVEAIEILRQSDIYNILKSVHDWDRYFTEQSDALQKEIESMKHCGELV